MVKAKIKALILVSLNVLLKDIHINRKLKNELQKHSIKLDELQHVDIPYQLKTAYSEKVTSLKNLSSEGEGAVIISGRFRSGTTLFWNMFRNAEGYQSFYEPFNERRWFDPSVRGHFVDSTHRGVSDYWAEYESYGKLKDYYKEDWIRKDLLMTKEHWEPDMFMFVNYLINNTEKRPVLQFNRIDFRLPWFKRYFPKAKYIHIFRNPRDQFCSFLNDKQKMNSGNVHETYVDGFYLFNWCDDLSTHFPFLSRKQNLHPYRYFYFIWKLSYVFGTTYSDLSVSYEDLVLDTEVTLNRIFSFLQDESIDTKKMAEMIDNPAIGGWELFAESCWFEEHESYCEDILGLFFKN